MDEQILQIKNSETFRRLLNVVRDNIGNITEVVINDNEITVRKKSEILFKHQPLPGYIFSINEQRFLYESVEIYFDSEYEFFTNLEAARWQDIKPRSKITKKGISSW